MKANRRQFMSGALAAAVAAKLESANAASRWVEGDPYEAAPSAAPYGSGHFGRWSEDEFDLPAFEYTCNQTSDPLATLSFPPGILMPNEHIHQVGNDRITAIASNFGHVRVRQDEGGPKILNDVDPEAHQYGGGIGWLTDGHSTLSTWYDGKNSAFERKFGIGYFRKRVASRDYAVDHVVWAPFGDDPVLLSQVKITNSSSVPADLTWVEYWGCQPYQLSFRDSIEAGAAKLPVSELRRGYGRRFTHKITKIGTDGLLDSKSFPGRTPEEEARWQGLKAYFNTHPTPFFANVKDPQPGAWYDTGNLPQTFLVSLDAPADALSTDAAAFFGAGGPSHPSGLESALTNSPADSGSHGALILARKLHLAPKAERTLTFLYGYLPDDFALDSLVAKYRTATLRQSSAEWKKHGLHFEAAGEPWTRRESAWNHYYLRSSLTFDDYFGEHILNENGIYQYVMGVQLAARDPLQHCLPFLFSDPEIVRSVLRYTLKEIRDDGSVPYAIAGHGVVAPMASDNASDLPLWLIWVTSEYVLATRDTAFLNERIPARLSDQPGRTDTVRNLLARCFRHQVDYVGLGEHGLVRMLNDDWNDALISCWATSALNEAVEKSESVLNTTMSAWVFDYYSRMLHFAGDSSDTGAKAAEMAEKLRRAGRAQWAGKWFKRAWLGPTLGWLGEDTLWLEQQPWAIVAGITTPDQSRQLVDAINTRLRKSPIGAAQMGEGPDTTKSDPFPPGTAVNGGVWPSLNQTLVWALAKVDPAMAWDEWKKNSFARHADVYPNIWYGVWSGPDTYNSFLSKQPGETVNSPFFSVVGFPVLNVHSHACFLYSIAKLLSVEFNPAGLSLAPEILVENYKLESPLLGVIKKAAGHYEGWYMPSKGGTWLVTIKLPRDLAKKVANIKVNGKSTAVQLAPDGSIFFRGASEEGKPLRWSLG